MNNLPRNVSSPNISCDWDHRDTRNERKSLDDNSNSFARAQHNIPDHMIPLVPKPAQLKSSKTIRPTKNRKPVRPNKSSKIIASSHNATIPITAKDISEPRPVLHTVHTSIKPDNTQSSSSIDSPNTTRTKIFDLIAELQIENQIKMGAENLLQIYDREKKEERKKQATSELDAANHKISRLREQLERLGVSKYDQLNQISKKEPSKPSEKVVVAAVAEVKELVSQTKTPVFSLADILESLEAQNGTPEFLIEQSNSLVVLLSQNPSLRSDLEYSKIGVLLRQFLLNKRTEVVAAGYRTTRHILTDSSAISNPENIKTLLSSTLIDISLIIIRSLAKDAKCQLERIHALKLVRSFLDLPNCRDFINVGIIRSLVAVAEQTDDKISPIAIETLAEAFIRDPKLVSSGDGTRILIQAVTEGPFEIAAALAMSLAHSLDSPINRKLLRNGRDLEYLISSFTDYQKTHNSAERLKVNAAVLTSLLKTWQGVCVFANHEHRLLKDLISCFRYPIPVIRETLLDLFFALFQVHPKTAWSASFIAGQNVPAPDISKNPVSGPSKLRDHYLSLLLMLVMKCGLIENLTEVLKNADDSTNSRRAALLLVELLNIGSKILPQEQLFQLVKLEGLWNYDPDDQIKQPTILNGQLHSSLVFQIDFISRQIQASSTKPEPTKLPQSINTEPNVPTAIEIKKQIGVQIDDNNFKQLLADTQVLTTKTHSKWNWEALTDLIQGPLLNPKRLDDTVRNTKFMKRLMSFYRPFKYRFSSIKNTRPNLKCVRVGQELIHTLLQTSYGVKYLTENKLLRQIAECLAQIDPMSGITSADPLFSPNRLENTLSHGYFAMLGTLSADPNGIAMMERWRMFNMFYHIAELRSREDLIVSFIRNMDYNLVGHPRIIFAKALTTGQKNVRLAGTAHLRTLLSSQASSSKNPATKETQQWAISLLATQLFDPELEVCRLAVSVIDDFCGKSVSNLEYFVNLQPSLDHLGDIGTPLLLKFLSTSKGFNYLKGSDYVLHEMEKWFEGGMNERYVDVIEEHIERVQRTWSFFGQHDKRYDNLQYGGSIAAAAVAAGLGSTTTTLSALLGSESEGLGDGRRRGGTGEEEEEGSSMPRHFYGELTLTDEGCQLLRSKGHFELFCEYVRQYGLISTPQSLQNGSCSTRTSHQRSSSNILFATHIKSNYNQHHHRHLSRASIMSESSVLPMSLQLPASEQFLNTPYNQLESNILPPQTTMDKIIVKLKGCLWAIGHASMNELGIGFLESSHIAADIISIAEKSRIASVKGTAFFVLGLLGNTIDGAEILEDMGWKTKRMWNEGEVKGISIPENLETMFQGNNNKYYGGSEEDAGDLLNDELEAKKRLVNEGFINFDKVMPKQGTQRKFHDSTSSSNIFPNLQQLWEPMVPPSVAKANSYDLSSGSETESLLDFSEPEEFLANIDNDTDDDDMEPFPAYTPNPNNFDKAGNYGLNKVKEKLKKRSRSTRTFSNLELLNNTSLHPFHQTLLKALSDLSNQILANDASKTLVQLSRNTYSFPEDTTKSKHHQNLNPRPTKHQLSGSDKLFKSTVVFEQVMLLLSTFRYRQPMRKFVFELFDVPALMEKIAREKESCLIRSSLENHDNQWHQDTHVEHQPNSEIINSLPPDLTNSTDPQSLEPVTNKYTAPSGSQNTSNILEQESGAGLVREISHGSNFEQHHNFEEEPDSVPLATGNMITFETESDEDVMLPFP